MCSNIDKKNQSQKSHPEKDTKPQIDGFYWLSSNFPTKIFAHKSAKKNQINQQWPSSYVVEVEG